MTFNHPCPCCDRYAPCSWVPYYVDSDPDRDPFYDFTRMPDTTVRGLADGYDDGKIDAVIEEMLRLRSLVRAYRLESQPVIRETSRTVTS
jgi:hypothetical protein